MGAATSRQPPMDEKSAAPDAVARRNAIQQLRAAVQKDDDGQYVLIEKKSSRGPPPQYSHVPRQTGISLHAPEDWHKQLLEDPKNRLAVVAFSTNNAHDILSSPAAFIADTQVFNIKIPIEGSPVTNQRISGRCWLFASTNVFRVALMKKYKLESFELSQAYLFFWDKLEKANYFLESVLHTVDEPLDGRLLQTLLASPVGDGGQWDMVANLVQKYGLVPQCLYPDSFNAQDSGLMDRLLTTKLREDALRLRAMASSTDPAIRSTIQGAKDKMLQDIHLILTIMLGPPPNPNKEFNWTFYDKDNKFQSVTLTPAAFAASMSEPSTVRACSGTDVSKLFSLVNDPRNEYLQLLSVSWLGNVWNGRPVTYVNVDMVTMKRAAIAMLSRGLPVFFGCDVSKSSDSQRGIMDTHLYDYELGFNVRLAMDKTERLIAGHSSMTHAMVLTAVHVEDGKPVRWRVQNSWSETAGDKGFFVMTDAWMDEFTYQVVVDPSFVSEEVRKVLTTKPKMLDLWDPMGSLA